MPCKFQLVQPGIFAGLLLLSAGQVIAAPGSSMMPGSSSDNMIKETSLVEALYPEVLAGDSDPFNTKAIDKSYLLAQADAGGSGQGGAPAEVSAECAAFAADPSADVGDILRAGCKPSLAQMSALMDNPLGNVAMLFTQFDFYQKREPESDRTDTQFNYMGIFQFPKKLGSNWNMINRIIWNIPSMPLSQDKIDDGFSTAPPGELLPPPGGIPGNGPLPIDIFGGRTTGLGDTIWDALFSPQKPVKLKGGGVFAWGVGFDVGMPTASEDILGGGKWTAGPSALGVYMGPKWKVGALVTHFEDFAGSKNRSDVSLTNLQYFLFYSMSDTFAIGAAPNIICNWELVGDNCTVPIGIGMSTTVNIGKVPVRFGAEVHYSIITPDDSLHTEWDFRFYIIPAAPSALFKWMN